jgi:phosphoribosylformimino-5-aminoimidazole carboxamide ribotide isomerase
VILFPAVDIRGGRAVRLRLGRFEEEIVYAASPLDAARAWVDAGARWLHVVDLDGARTGEPRHLDELRTMKAALAVPVQYGGGLRSLDDVRAALEAGADRVMLGTAALRDEELLAGALALRGPERVVVAVDARGGRVAVAGWTEETSVAPKHLLERLERLGAATFLYTNVDRDGTLEGPDLAGARRIAERIAGRLIVSGGISSLADLEAVRELGLENVEGVVAGKALYERRFTVTEGNAALAAAPGGAGGPR